MTEASFRVVIPTRNGGRWLAAFVRAYERLGLHALYIVDARTRDDSRAILDRFGCEWVEVRPQYDRGEDVLWRGAAAANAPWLLRMDDDELPSRALLAFMRNELARRDEPAIYISTRQAWHGGYSRMEDFYFNHARPDFLLPQPRLFRPDRIRYVSDLHTPGIDPTGAGWAPPEAYYLHTDWLVRDFAARVAKLESYESQRPGGGRSFAKFSLPELQAPDRLRITPWDTDEFDPLLAELAALMES